jgi:hypothetical protein
VTLTNNGNAALNVSGVAISGANAGDFAETDTCSGKSVAAGANCAINVTFMPGASGALSAAVTITDNAGNSPQTVAISGTGTSVAIGPASGAQTSSTVTAGQTATFTLQLNAAGAQQTVSLTCTGAPAGATCNVPASVLVPTGPPTPVNVSVSTTARAFTLPAAPRDRKPPFAWPIPLAFLALLLLFASRAKNALATRAGAQLATARQRRPQLMPQFMLQFMPKWATLLPLTLLLVSGALLAGCGGGSAPRPTGTPAGTSTITVTATSNGASQSQQLTLTVQ